MRTFDPKYSHYFSNGSGRDNFIGYNNGGFSIPKIHGKFDATNFMRLGNLGGGATSGNTSPRMEPKPLEYRSDGTGRDSYIVCNSGGLKQ